MTKTKMMVGAILLVLALLNIGTVDAFENDFEEKDQIDISSIDVSEKVFDKRIESLENLKKALGERDWDTVSDYEISSVTDSAIQSDIIHRTEASSESSLDTSGYFVLEGDANLLWSYESSGSYYDIDMYPLNDIDGDGIYDFVVSDEVDDDDKILAVSGSDGSTIWSKDSPGNVESVISVNKENDIVVSYYIFNPDLEDVYLYVALLRGSTGETIWTQNIANYDVELWADLDGLDSVGDVNGDGTEDIYIQLEIESEDDIDDKSYVLSSSDGSILCDLPYYVYWEFADLTGDGLTDFVVEDYDWDTDYHYIAVIRGTDESVVWESTSNVEVIGIIDANNDGISDLVTFTYEGNLNALKVNDGSVIWGEEFEIEGYPWYITNLKDANDDGSADFALLFEDYYGNVGVQFRSNSDGKSFWDWISPVATYDIEVCADMDGDGIEDITCANSEEVAKHEYHVTLDVFKGNDGRKICEWSDYVTTNSLDSAEWSLEWSYFDTWTWAICDINGDNIVDPVMEIESNSDYLNDETWEYMSSSENFVIAIDGSDSSTLWKFETGKTGEYSGLWSMLTAYGDLNGDNIADYLFANNAGAYAIVTNLDSSSNEVPTAEVMSIIPDSIVVGDTITFNGTGSDTDGSIVAYNWRSDINGILSADANFSTSSLSPGTHTIYFKVKDNDGNWSPEETWTVKVDDGVPFVSIETGFTSYIGTNNPVNVTLYSSDLYPGTSEFVIQDNSDTVVFTENVTEKLLDCAYVFTWNASNHSGTPLPSGTYTLNLLSTDQFGHFGADNVSLMVDNTAPSIDVNSISGTNTVDNVVNTNSSLLVNASVSGTPGEATKVDVVLSSTFSNFRTTFNAALDDGFWMGEFDLSSVSDDGSYEATIVAQDAAKNINSTVSEKLIKIDRVAPCLSSTFSRINDTHAYVNVTSTETLEGNPVVTINGIPVVVEFLDNYWTGIFQMDDSDTYTVNVEGMDLAGNTGTSESIVHVASVDISEDNGSFSSDSGLMLNFSANGTFTDNITVSESTSSFMELSSGHIGLCILDIQLGDELEDKLSNATISIPVNESMVPVEMTVDDVSICYYNESSGKWEELETTVQNINGEYYWVTEVEHFSTYAAIASDSVAPELEDVIPSSGSTFDKGTTDVDIRFNYSDFQTGINISSIVLKFDGVDVTGGDNVTITGSYALYNATGLTAGEHSASVYVADYAGNAQTFRTVFIIATSGSDDSSNGGSGSSSSGGGGGGGTTGEKYENILVKEVQSIFVNKDSHIMYEFKEEGNAITFIQFDSLKNSGKIQAIIEVLKGRSSFAEEKAPGNVYQQMNIWVGKAGFVSPENIENMIIGFKVEKSWIEENNIESNTMKLYRYSQNTWHALDTSIVDEDEEYIYLESQTPGFSPFAIGSETGSIENGEEISLKSVSEEDSETGTDVNQSTETTGQVGSLGVFTILSMISFVLAATFVLYRKRS